MNAILSTLSSAPSIEGFGSAALANIIGKPFIFSSAAVAALAFTIVSNPAEIWARGSAHHAVRDDLQKVIKPSLETAFKNNSEEWEGEDRKAFEEHRMQPAYAAIDAHAEQTDSLGRQHHIIAGVLQAAGALSAVVGSALLVQALVVRGLTFSGPFAGPAIATANIVTGTAKNFLQKAVQKLFQLAEKLKTLLKLSMKKMMVLGVTLGALVPLGMMTLGGGPSMPTDGKSMEWPTVEA